MYEAVISKVPVPVSMTNLPSASVTPPSSVPSTITFAPTSGSSPFPTKPVTAYPKTSPTDIIRTEIRLR